MVNAVTGEVVVFFWLVKSLILHWWDEDIGEQGMENIRL